MGSRLSKGSLYHAKTCIAQANYHMPQYCPLPPTHTRPVKNYSQARQNTQSFLMYSIFLVNSALNVPYCVMLNIFIKKTPTNTKIETKRKVNTHTQKRETVTQRRTKHLALNLSYLTKKIIMSLMTSFVYWPPQGESMYVVFTVD